MAETPVVVLSALQRTISFLLSCGKLEKLFCVPVPVCEALRLRAIIVQGYGQKLRQSDSLGVGAVMLFLLKDLKGVLIPSDLQPLLLAATRVFSVHCRLYVLRILFAKLPCTSFELLKCLSRVLLKIQEHNKERISLLKLAVLVGPFLIQSDMNGTDASRRLRAVTVFAVTMLKEQEYLFSSGIGQNLLFGEFCNKISTQQLQQAQISSLYSCPKTCYGSFHRNIRLPGLFNGQPSSFICKHACKDGSFCSRHLPDRNLPRSESKVLSIRNGYIYKHGLPTIHLRRRLSRRRGIKCTMQHVSNSKQKSRRRAFFPGKQSCAVAGPGLHHQLSVPGQSTAALKFSPNTSCEPVPPPPLPSRPRPPPPPPPPPPLPPPPPPPRQSPPQKLPTQLPEVERPKLKQLIWDKLTPMATAETVWAKTGIKGVNVDLQQLETLFALNNLETPIKNVSTRIMKPSKVHLIDLKRAHNVSIQLSSLRRPFSELVTALNAMDEQFLSSEALVVINRTLPTKEDVSVLKGYTGDIQLLADVERYYMDIMKISRIEKRIRVCMFKQQYKNIAQIKQDFEMLIHACAQLHESKTLVRILEMVLAVGNHLNGNSYRGAAKGFKVDTLLKLMDIKGSNRKTTLLHFVVLQLCNTNVQVKALSDELREFKLAASLNLERMQANLKEIDEGFQTLNEEANLPENTQFRNAVMPFLQQAKTGVSELKSLEERAVRKYRDLALYLGEDPRTGRQTHLFCTIQKFINMFDSVYKELEKETGATKPTKISCAKSQSASDSTTGPLDYDSDWSTS